jgi:hypothetical protein
LQTADWEKAMERRGREGSRAEYDQVPYIYMYENSIMKPIKKE